MNLKCYGTLLWVIKKPNWTIWQWVLELSSASVFIGFLFFVHAVKTFCGINFSCKQKICKYFLKNKLF